MKSENLLLLSSNVLENPGFSKESRRSVTAEGEVRIDLLVWPTVGLVEAIEPNSRALSSSGSSVARSTAWLSSLLRLDVWGLFLKESAGFLMVCNRRNWSRASTALSRSFGF